MNQLTEYLNLYKNGLLNLDKVIESRIVAAKRKLGNLAPDVEAEIDRRVSICVACPFNSVNAKTSEEYLGLYGKHYHTERPVEELHCSICTCPIDYKTTSLSSNCGIEYWNKDHPDLQLPLFWTAYPPNV